MRRSDAVELMKLRGPSLLSSISQMGWTNFLESYLAGNFFRIRERQRTAFFLTLIPILLVKATYMTVSATEDTKVSGTIVAIIENASD